MPYLLVLKFVHKDDLKLELLENICHNITGLVIIGIVFNESHSFKRVKILAGLVIPCLVLQDKLLKKPSTIIKDNPFVTHVGRK